VNDLFNKDKTQFLRYSVLFIAIIISLMVYFDLFRLTGYVSNVNTSANITVGGSTPSILLVDLPLQTVNVIDGGFIRVNFSFLADDQDGLGDLNNATANATFTVIAAGLGSGVELNDTLCDADVGVNSTVQNYSCSIDIRYFDRAATNGWNVNASIYDLGGLTGNSNGIASSVVFSVNSLLAINMTPTALTWLTLTVGQLDALSNNDPLLIGNTGNANVTTGNVNMTAIDLGGETTTTQVIPAANFTANVADACDTGSALSNATSTLIASSTLPTGLDLGEIASDEQIYLCLESVPSSDQISAQSYSTANVGSWDVGVS
jgi:hypothetical protein